MAEGSGVSEADTVRVLQNMGAENRVEDPVDLVAMQDALKVMNLEPQLSSRVMGMIQNNAAASADVINSVRNKAKEISSIRQGKEEFVLKLYQPPGLIVEQINRVMADFNVVMEPVDGVGHSYARVSRDIYRIKLDRMLREFVPKTEGIRVKGAGDNRWWFIKHGITNHHTCQGYRAGVADEERKADFLARLAATETLDGAKQNELLRAHKEEWYQGKRNPYACKNYVQDCDVKADVIRVVHAGDITPHDVGLAMIKSGAKIAGGIMHYHPSVWITTAKTGVLPFTKMTWQKRTVNGEPCVIYSARSDNQPAYVHKIKTQRAWFVGNKIIRVYHNDEVRKFMIVHVETELDTLMWKMVPVEASTKEVLHSKVPMPSAEDYTIISPSIYDPTRRRTYFGGYTTSVKTAMMRHVLCVPKKLFDDTSNYMMNTKNDFTVQSTSRALGNHIAKDRNPSNPSRYSELLPQNPDVLMAVATHIYGSVFERRAIQSASVGESIRQIKEHSDITKTTVYKKFKNIVLRKKSSTTISYNSVGIRKSTTRSEVRRSLLEQTLMKLGLDATKRYNALPETFEIGDNIPIDESVNETIMDRLINDTHVNTTVYDIPSSFITKPRVDNCDNEFEVVDCSEERKGDNTCLVDSFVNRLNALSGIKTTVDAVYNVIMNSPLLNAYSKKEQKSIADNVFGKGLMPLNVCAILAFEYDVCVKVHNKRQSYIFGDSCKNVLHMMLTSNTHVQPCRPKAEMFPTKILDNVGESAMEEFSAAEFREMERYAKEAALVPSDKGRYTENWLETLLFDKALGDKNHKTVWDVGGMLSRRVVDNYNISPHSGKTTSYGANRITGVNYTDLAADIDVLARISTKAGKKFDMIYFNTIIDGVDVTNQLDYFINVLKENGSILILADLENQATFLNIDRFLSAKRSFSFRFIRDCSISLMDSRIGVILRRDDKVVKESILVARDICRMYIRKGITVVRKSKCSDEGATDLKERLAQLNNVITLENMHYSTERDVINLKSLTVDTSRKDVPEFSREGTRKSIEYVNRLRKFSESFRLKRKRNVTYVPTKAVTVDDCVYADTNGSATESEKNSQIVPSAPNDTDDKDNAPKSDKTDDNDGGAVGYVKAILTDLFDTTVDVSDKTSENTETTGDSASTAKTTDKAHKERDRETLSEAESLSRSLKKDKKLTDKYLYPEYKDSIYKTTERGDKVLTDNSERYDLCSGKPSLAEYRDYLKRGMEQMKGKVEEVLAYMQMSKTDREIMMATGNIDFVEYGPEGQIKVGEKSTIRTDEIDMVYSLYKNTYVPILEYIGLAAHGNGKAFAISEFAPCLLPKYTVMFNNKSSALPNITTSVSIIQAVAGAGKSFAIRKEIDLKKDMLIVHSRAAQREMCEKLTSRCKTANEFYQQMRENEKPYFNKYVYPNIKTMAAALLSPSQPISGGTLYIDEYLQFHRAEIDKVIVTYMPTNVVVLGDTCQTKFISHVKGFAVYKQVFGENERPSKVLSTSYRAPKSLEPIIREIYAQSGLRGYKTLSEVKGKKPVVKKYNNENDIKNVIDGDIITYTSADKTYINSVLRRNKRKPIAKTIAEYQGSESDNIILMRIGNTANKSGGIFEDKAMHLTALTRAKASFTYITSADNDSLSKFIRRFDI